MPDASTQQKWAFKKRVSPPGLFFRDLLFVLWHLPGYVGILVAKRVGFAFAERLRLVTTAVNQCVICARLHVELGELAGIDREEIRALLNNDLDRRYPAQDHELPGLLYAQHYAESGRAPLPDRTRQLREHYGEAAARDITLILRLINFFNLAGNTLEASLTRLKGGRVPGNPFAEFVVALISAPVALPFYAYTYRKGNRFRFAEAQAREAPGVAE